MIGLIVINTNLSGVKSNLDYYHGLCIYIYIIWIIGGIIWPIYIYTCIYIYIYETGYRYHQSYHQYDGILTIPSEDGSP